jgi:hypothetical protein
MLILSKTSKIFFPLLTACKVFLISNFCHVLYVVCFLLGNYLPTFLWRWNRQCSEMSAYKIQTPWNYPELHIQQLVRCYIYNKLKVKFIPTSKRHRTLHKISVLSNMQKRDWTLATCTFNWNTTVTVHLQETVGFLQGKKLPNSTASSSVSNSLTHIIIPTQIWRKHFLPKH